MEIVALVLLALAIPVAAVAGFVMGLVLLGRTRRLEARLVLMERRLGFAQPAPMPGFAPAPGLPPFPYAPQPPYAAPGPAWPPAGPFPPVPQPPPGPTPPGPESAEAAPPAAGPAAPPPRTTPPIAPPPGPVPAAPGFEERLGTRWAVWVGGVALALGGLFLVRYSIEQGLLGPTARVIAGALFALALIAAGEILRRREGGLDLGALPSATIPGVLTAAGTSTAFATVYAAYALYGMLPGGLALVILGAIALATMVAAALHGPALAGLGLLGALGAPLLVSSTEPQAWPLVLYVGFVVLAAYGLARLRLWRWLALSATVGAGLWTLPMLALAAATGIAPAMAHVVVQLALAGAFLVADPHRRDRDEEARPDLFASLVLLGFAILAWLAATMPEAGAARPVFAALVAVLLLGLAIRFPSTAAGAPLAALLAVATLLTWPLAEQAASEAPTMLPDLLAGSPRPQALGTFLTFACGTLGLVTAASLWRLSRGRALPLVTAGLLLTAPTAGPLLGLVVAYWRVAELAVSLPFALAAAALSAAFVAVARLFRRQEGEALDAIRLTVGGTAAAAVAMLALGLTFALEKGMLTVAFALAALGTAYVAERARLPVLRYAVGAVGLLVLGRLAYDPTIVPDPGRGLVLNWFLWGYGVPAIAFALAARLLERSGRDRVVRLVESLAFAFATLLVFFEIRHAVNGGDALAPRSDHLEVGLMATASLLFSLVLVRIEAAKPDPLYRVASLVYGALTLGLAGLGLAMAENPLFTGEPVRGGAVLNSLLPAYLMPALLAAVLAFLARRTRPRWFVRGAAGLALALHLLYTVLEIRRLFQGPVVGAWLPTSQGELWSYSVALIAVGVVLLALGLVLHSRFLRLLSLLYVLAATAKVFFIDLANLQGATRALSLIGLGLALIGIGLVYQRLLARRAAGPAPAT